MRLFKCVFRANRRLFGQGKLWRMFIRSHRRVWRVHGVAVLRLSSQASCLKMQVRRWRERSPFCFGALHSWVSGDVILPVRLCLLTKKSPLATNHLSPRGERLILAAFCFFFWAGPKLRDVFEIAKTREIKVLRKLATIRYLTFSVVWEQPFDSVPNHYR